MDRRLFIRVEPGVVLPKDPLTFVTLPGVIEDVGDAGIAMRAAPPVDRLQRKSSTTPIRTRSRILMMLENLTDPLFRDPVLGRETGDGDTLLTQLRHLIVSFINVDRHTDKGNTVRGMGRNIWRRFFQAPWS